MRFMAFDSGFFRSFHGDGTEHSHFFLKKTCRGTENGSAKEFPVEILSSTACTIPLLQI